MLTTNKVKTVQARSESCSKATGFTACQQYLSANADDVTINKNIESLIQKFDYSIDMRIAGTNDRIIGNIRIVNQAIESSFK